MKSPQPPQQPHSEAGTFCKHSWGSPCPRRSLPPRSWPWGRPECNTIHLLRPVVHQVGHQPVLGVCINGDILRAGNIAICCFFWSWLKLILSEKTRICFELVGFLLVREAFITRFECCLHFFANKDSLFTLCHTIEIHSFPMSAITHFCDKLLPKFLDPNSVVIYCPRPVIMQ